MIVCLAANPSIDKLFEVDRLVKGDIHRPDGFVEVAGGKGLNVARAAQALGADVRAVALLRGHTGKWLDEMLSAEGVPAALRLDPRREPRVAERRRPRDGRPDRVLRARLRGASRRVDRADADGVDRWTPGGWLTISGSLPRGAADDGYRDLVAEARAAGVHVAPRRRGRAAPAGARQPVPTS